MENQKVYLVYEEFDNGAQWSEDRVNYEWVLGASLNLELAKEKLKYYRDKLLAKEFMPYNEWLFPSTREDRLTVHEVGAFEVEMDGMIYDGMRYDVVVRCKDETEGETGDTGLYTYRIEERELDKFLEEPS